MQKGRSKFMKGTVKETKYLDNRKKIEFLYTSPKAAFPKGVLQSLTWSKTVPGKQLFLVIAKKLN